MSKTQRAGFGRTEIQFDGDGSLDGVFDVISDATVDSGVKCNGFKQI